MIFSSSLQLSIFTFHSQTLYRNFSIRIFLLLIHLFYTEQPVNWFMCKDLPSNAHENLQKLGLSLNDVVRFLLNLQAGWTTYEEAVYDLVTLSVYQSKCAACSRYVLQCLEKERGVTSLEIHFETLMLMEFRSLTISLNRYLMRWSMRRRRMYLQWTRYDGQLQVIDFRRYRGA